MREALKERVGKRGPFTAMFVRTSSRSNRYGVRVFVLLRDVRDEAGPPVTDHLWFNMGLQIERLKLKEGDRIRFKATVAPYRKRNPDSDGYEDWADRYVIDYKLRNPSNFCLIERTESRAAEIPETLPLFQQMEAR